MTLWVPVLRPDLARPADFGTDTSNYAAAGERLTDAELYRLGPGDRPVPADNPPDWSRPILSPPPVATLWSALTILPDVVRFHLIWALGMAASFGLVALLIWRLPILVSIVGLYLFAIDLGIMAWSGNLNALVAPGLAAVWWLAERPQDRRLQILAGVIVGMAAMVKLGPVFLLIWLAARGRWHATGAALATMAAGLLVTVWIAGTGPFIEYASIIRESSALPADLSIPGLAVGLGIPVAYGLGLLVFALGAAVVVILAGARRFAAVTFAVAVTAAVFETTVVRPETLVVAAAAWAPLAAVSRPALQRHPYRFLPVLGATCLVVLVSAVAVAVLGGGSGRSSLTITNGLSEAVVVRFSAPSQGASFGFAVGPGESGAAWRNQMGAAAGDVYVFTRECRLLHTFPFDRSRSAIGVMDGGISELAARATDALSFDAACAAELRALL